MDIIDLSSKIRPDFKYSLLNRKRGKRLLVDSMKEYIPSNVLNHPKKGWVSPISKWIRKGLRDLVNETLHENYNPDLKNILNFKKINAMVDDHMSQKRYGAETIWMLLKFQLWYKTFKK